MLCNENMVQSKQVLHRSGCAQVEKADSPETMVLLWYVHPGQRQPSPHPQAEGIGKKGSG
jgi:hypothetical protein